MKNKIQLQLFQSDKCSVCHAIEPKISMLCEKKFPQIEFTIIRAEESPKHCGQNRIFSFPAVLIVKNGREVWRKLGAMGINEIEQALTNISESEYR